MAHQALYQTVNPANGQVVKTFPTTTDEQVFAALGRAHEVYQKDWRRRSVGERCQIMAKAAALMRERKQELAEIAVLEMGKTIGGMLGEVEFSAAILNYYAKNGEQFLRTVDLPGVAGAVIASEPIGVILAIEPWNFPYYQVARVAGPQLVAGNTVMLKHAQSVPQCAIALEKLFADAGAPAGVYTNLFCSIPQINALIADFRVRGVTLTGSERAGASVAENAGRHLKKVVLELGGSDPLVVLEDAPLDQAIEVAAAGRMMCMGQACASIKRYVVVGKERGQQFLDGVKAKFEAMKAGDPMDPATTLGPLFSEKAVDDLVSLIDEAKAAGATIVMGGKRIDRPGYYLEPTLITNVSQENPLFLKEAFGPVATLYVVDTEAEAIELANATTFGLGSSVFSSNVEHAKKVAAEIEAGMVFINSAVNSGPDVPFGGVKNSGFGRELGELGIQEFLNKKLIRVHQNWL
ncbi:succinate-semialdehyde dehydrogenase (NADP+) [Cladophialophora psammophila CBS 110553]|uniref:Succinate-semialdehyde dehydrogenase (NADP+) n=1 Tax=Cladophialophora psammophila CBS 110553 TaxID=1182543 RepID=W9WVC5_9EURO|nr:succinate-semialdehyde dehydrogenase (NADP+) [Cladophialophora psammophila CBS 110553]EXJ72157.1 succinate-semialdehyde dehydrogenase (NADP+) [Cladophialophora psammophila CBS 110553]